MNKTYLGIDTSNYRTSAALYHASEGTFQNEGRLLTVPEGTIGLRQSEALFQHVTRLHEMISGLPYGCASTLGAVGVSTRPRAVEGSYMPCFLAGISVAESAAHLLGVPLFICSHQQGHVAAAALSAGELQLLGQSFLAWHLSGGTTELLLVKPGEDRMPRATRIGGTTDLAAGQLIDRCGCLLKLPFPAGPALEILSKNSVKKKHFTVKIRDLDFSLSGMENKLKRMQLDGENGEDIASYCIETILKTVENVTEIAVKEYSLPVLCAGGVMSNARIQNRMRERFETMVATPQLSGDNAVGVAVLAAMQNGERLF